MFDGEDVKDTFVLAAVYFIARPLDHLCISSERNARRSCPSSRLPFIGLVLGATHQSSLERAGSTTTWMLRRLP